MLPENGKDISVVACIAYQFEHTNRFKDLEYLNSNKGVLLCRDKLESVNLLPSYEIVIEDGFEEDLVHKGKYCLYDSRGGRKGIEFISLPDIHDNENLENTRRKKNICYQFFYS